MAKAPKKFKCEVSNIWTSKGKLTKGDEVELSADEVKALVAAQKDMK